MICLLFKSPHDPRVFSGTYKNRAKWSDEGIQKESRGHHPISFFPFLKRWQLTFLGESQGSLRGIDEVGTADEQEEEEVMG